jgi:hypothetical protein
MLLPPNPERFLRFPLTPRNSTRHGRDMMHESLVIELGSFLAPPRYMVSMVEAVMVWPDEDAVRARVLDFALHETARAMPSHVFTAAGWEDLARHPGPPPFEWLPERLKRLQLGRISGTILYRAVCSADREGVVDLGQIKRDLAGEYKPEDHISVARIESAWRDFRPVASLWASWVAEVLEMKSQSFPSDAAGEAAIEQWFKRQPFPCSAASLPRFLSRAEWFRRRGESIRTHAKGLEILRRGESAVIRAEIVASEWAVQS